MQDIANDLQAKLNIHCDEFILDIPANYGSGTITGINLGNGLGYIHYNCTFLQDFEIKFTNKEVHPLKFIYCAQGTVCHRFQHESELRYILKYKSCIVASTIGEGHILMFRGSMPNIINSIEVDRSVFSKTNKCSIELCQNKLLKAAFLDVKGNLKFFSIGDYSLLMTEQFQKMDDLSRGTFSHLLFAHGICYQILGIQLELENAASQSILTIHLRKREIEQIKAAATFLKENLSDFTNIENLCKKIGINGNKLQYGFKLMYHHTINQYIQNLRLHQAADLLKDSENSIANVVAMIGLESKSYFSLIFRRRYGISPTQYRQEMKDNTTTLDF